MKPILEVNGVSKRFSINHELEPYLSIRDRLTSFLRRGRTQSEEFWALRDVTFEVNPGESIGIIGKNGAGKSTLLKILSKITPPSKGLIRCRGRMASLLEVGTGFHPELTGRENVFLNGSILGMKRKAIEEKFDEIVSFAGTERFLDTPLKHYSSGMQLRLAFAVAAFLEQEILIIDEVLAVGDAEFQKKCLGKMEDITKSGRTILFVSHNMAAVQNLCTRGILLAEGTIRTMGVMADVVEAYHDLSAEAPALKLFEEADLWLSGFSTVSAGNGPMMTGWDVTFNVEVESKIELTGIFIGIGVNDTSGTRVFTLFSKFQDRKYAISKGKNYFTCSIQAFALKPGIYYAEIYVGDGISQPHFYYNHNLRFEVLPSEKINYASIPDASQGHFLMNESWS